LKNLLTYINKNKRFDETTGKAAEIQIDNGLRYWDKKDIIVATNFPWKYKGVKAVEVPDDLWRDFHPMASKPGVVVHLIKRGIIREMAWLHDFDLFQLADLDLPPIKKNIAFTTYGFMMEINCGSIVITPKSLDIFEWICEAVDTYKTHDEEAVNILVKSNFNNISERIQFLNQTYNVGARNTKSILRLSDRPIRTAHFTPSRKNWREKFRPILDNKLNALIDERFTYLDSPGRKI